jgi:hypothetical protein
VLAARAQPLLLETLRKRDVLLRLLGVQKIARAGLAVLFNGGQKILRLGSVAKVVEDLAPPPVACCACLVAREYGLHFAPAVGATLYLPIFCLRVSPGLALFLGMTTASATSATVACVATMTWFQCNEACTAPWRLAWVLPFSADGRSKALESMQAALNRKVKKVAVQWSAGALVRRALPATASAGWSWVKGVGRMVWWVGRGGR